MERLRAMGVFANVAERGSFAKAADALTMSNASITEWVTIWNPICAVVLIRCNS
jgi:hypothetical protein